MLKVNKNDKGVYEVILNRPEIHNAFNDDLIISLTKAFKEISIDESARLVVLSGEGKSFCAGADLNWMKSMINYSREENKKDSEALYDLFYEIDNCPIPVFGKVNGHALGGGVGLLSVCDYVLTHEKAKFGFTEVRLGLIPAVISSFCLKKIGQSNARAWFLSGEKFDANIALKIGLVDKVSSVESFEENSKKCIESFLKAGPNAARSAKKLIKNVCNLDEPKDYTCSEIAKVRIAPEGQEGMSALLEKRKASWI